MGGYHEERFSNEDTSVKAGSDTVSFQSVDYLSDVIIVDGVQREASRAIEKTDFKFQCWSPSMLVGDGTVLSLVRDQ